MKKILVLTISLMLFMTGCAKEEAVEKSAAPVFEGQKVTTIEVGQDVEISPEGLNIIVKDDVDTLAFIPYDEVTEETTTYFTIEGTYDNTKTGENTLTVHAKDSEGNYSTLLYTINVVPAAE